MNIISNSDAFTAARTLGVQGANYPYETERNLPENLRTAFSEGFRAGCKDRSSVNR